MSQVPARRLMLSARTICGSSSTTRMRTTGQLSEGLARPIRSYVPPVLEALGLAEVEHGSRNNRMRAI
ncbi:DUF6855 family protein [Actinoplanes sp. NPDC051633]|uniref:DUF6855 family protein n=1 Tax=Actinoplanes sp. NPDC051633 TaxID=3155670 RepID=UPI0034185D7F